MGRIAVHEEFAPAWSTRTAEDDPGAPFMNDTDAAPPAKFALASSLAYDNGVAYLAYSRAESVPAA